jgi:hypothetical protein
MLPLLPALAQQPAATRAAPKAAQKAELSAEQRAELQQAVTRGRALFVLDQAARQTSADMLAKIPNPSDAGVVGWIAMPEGNGITVTYYAKEGETYSAVYRAQVLAGRVTSPQVFPAGSRPALTGRAIRMAAARAAAEAAEHARCGGPAFNLLVMPPDGDGPVLVYKMSPRMAADKVPMAGHYRLVVAPDGSIAESTPLAGECADLTIPRVRRGQRPAPLRVIARAPLPNELHVFLTLWTGRPIVVATGAAPVRLWGVTPGGIGELQQ